MKIDKQRSPKLSKLSLFATCESMHSVLSACAAWIVYQAFYISVWFRHCVLLAFRRGLPCKFKYAMFGVHCCLRVTYPLFTLQVSRINYRVPARATLAREMGAGDGYTVFVGCFVCVLTAASEWPSSPHK